MLVIAATNTGVVGAQTCGAVSVPPGSWVVAGPGAQFNDLGFGLSGVFLAGGSHVFGGFDISRLWRDDDLDSEVKGGVRLGARVPFDEHGRFELCPLMSGSRTGVRIGVTAGFLPTPGNGPRIGGAAELLGIYNRERPIDDPEGDRFSDAGVLARLRVSVALLKALTLVQWVSLPAGLQNRQVAFGVGIAISGAL
jgi:hypothetical protein